MARQIAETRRRIPQQPRAHATVNAILMAAAHILKSQGASALNTNRIAELAGVSIGSVYQYFTDKDAILEELRSRHSEWCEESLHESIERGTKLPLREGIRVSIDMLLSMHRLDPELQAGLSRDPSPLSPDDMAIFRGRMRRYLRENAEALRPVNPDIASVVITRAMQAVVHGTALEEPEWLSHPAFADEVTELVARYLER